MFVWYSNANDELPRCPNYKRVCLRRPSRTRPHRYVYCKLVECCWDSDPAIKHGVPKLLDSFDCLAVGTTIDPEALTLLCVRVFQDLEPLKFMCLQLVMQNQSPRGRTHDTNSYGRPFRGKPQRLFRNSNKFVCVSIVSSRHVKLILNLHEYKCWVDKPTIGPEEPHVQFC